MYILSMIILIFFAVLGICAFISAVLDAMYKGDNTAVLVIKNLEPDNAEARIRSAAHICEQHKGISLLCVCNKTDPAFDICQLMQKEYSFMEIRPEEAI